MGTTLQEIVDSFTSKIAERLDETKLDGPPRLDPTRTIVLLSVKGKGSIHVPVNQQINEQGVESVIHQIGLVPSLKNLIKGS
jgi:hypothetical protein